MRCCDEEGRLLLNYKGTLENRPPGHLPWFEVPNRRYDGPTIAFGHWSALGYRDTGEILALDTGCLWGGSLTAARLDGPLSPVSIDCAGCR
jgi:bis(5'-nucleosyl)-tetraphosphatase (symmetrical)